MTGMGKATRRTAAYLSAVVMLAAGSGAVTEATANADPDARQIRYTLTTGAPYEFQLTYLTAQPPNKAAYNANANAYLKRETVTVAPDAPWVFPTVLADPQWAFLQVSSTTRGGMAAPNARCEVAVDGQVVIQNEHPYSPRCLGSQW